MTAKEEITQALDGLSDADLQLVADYLAFLKSQEWRARPSIDDPNQIAALYAEFADEDRQLAEEGMAAFSQGLEQEDGQ